MKRWNFAGLEASHGVSISHRSPGFDRQPPGSRQDLQEQEDGRPSRRRAGHHAESGSGGGRCRQGPADDQGRGAGRARAATCWCATRSSARGRRMRRIPAALRRSRQRRAEDTDDADRYHHPRQGQRRHRRAAGRDFRASSRAPTSWRAWCTGSWPSAAPAPQDQGHGRGAGHHQEAVSSRRAPATRGRAACARRSSAPAAWCTGRCVRSHEYSLNKKVRRLGLISALSQKQADGKLVVLDAAAGTREDRRTGEEAQGAGLDVRR